MISLLQGFGPAGPEVLIIFLLFGIFFIAALIVPFFIYRDANDRNSTHALAWAVGSFFGGVFVWILYFFVRDEVGPS